MIGAKTIGKKLPPTQRAMLHLLAAERDVPIPRLYAKLYLEPRELRAQQQRVGSVICKLNKRLAEHGYRVQPGDKRGTYRLRPAA